MRRRLSSQINKLFQKLRLKGGGDEEDSSNEDDVRPKHKSPKSKRQSILSSDNDSDTSMGIDKSKGLK